MENEKQKSNSVQSKDETESNEKNTTSTGKLGLIVFKLRFVCILLNYKKIFWDFFNAVVVVAVAISGTKRKRMH